VADTESLIGYGGEHRKVTEEGERQGELGGEGSLRRKADVADTDSKRLQGWAQSGNACSSRAQRNEQPSRRSKLTDGQNWLVEPRVGRVAHGIPKRVDRLRGLGNAIVPQIAMKIGAAILQEIQSNDMTEQK